MASFPAGLASQLESYQGPSASEQQGKFLDILIGFPDRTFSSCPHDRVVLVLASPASTPDVPSPSEHVPVHISENAMDTSLIWLF